MTEGVYAYCCGPGVCRMSNLDGMLPQVGGGGGVLMEVWGLNGCWGLGTDKVQLCSCRRERWDRRLVKALALPEVRQRSASRNAAFLPLLCVPLWVHHFLAHREHLLFPLFLSSAQTCKYSSRRIRRYVTNHPVQMNLNTTAVDVVASTVAGDAA